MPTISVFYGISIRMYWLDHSPPHFHAECVGEEAVIDIRKLNVIRGSLRGRALALTLERAAIHREELLEDWHLCAAKRRPKSIRPLD